MIRLGQRRRGIQVLWTIGPARHRRILFQRHRGFLAAPFFLDGETTTRES